MAGLVEKDRAVVAEVVAGQVVAGQVVEEGLLASRSTSLTFALAPAKHATRG